LKYQDKNAAAITAWIADGWIWGQPISHETYVSAKNGDWDVVLTPTKPVPHTWLGDLSGKRVLGLAAGGGQQMPILAARGAVCTVFDYTPAQLESERMVSEREGYAIEIVRGDMSEPLPFADESFDLILHPVSDCYIENVRPLFSECFRLLTPGGVLLCGFDNGINFMVDESGKTVVHTFPYNPLQNPALMAQADIAGDGVQFSHTAEELIGGQLSAGFTLTDLYEDTNGEGYLEELHIPTFLATRAIKNKE